jgi:anti-anti-sigma regulatory factor
MVYVPKIDLHIMILCNVDESGRVLTMSYGGSVIAEEMRRCLGTIRDLMDQLKPGFILLTDLSNLEYMEASCARELGAIMDQCSAKGMLTVVQVIPDPNKDIGFDLISVFHLHPSVKTQTHQSLAEAIKSLLPGDESLEEPAENLSHDHSTRRLEENLAEARFTLAARKEAEVNEGGLVDNSASS